MDFLKTLAFQRYGRKKAICKFFELTCSDGVGAAGDGDGVGGGVGDGGVVAVGIGVAAGDGAAAAAAGDDGRSAS